MRLLALVLASSVIACTGACTGRGGVDTLPAPASRGADEVVAAARGVVEQWRQAWEVRSVEALGALYADAAEVVLVHQGRAHVGYRAVEAALAARLDGVTGMYVKLDDLQVWAVGDDAAVVSAAITREVSIGATTVKEQGAITMTLAAAADGRWEIVSEHYSFPTTTP